MGEQLNPRNKTNSNGYYLESFNPINSEQMSQSVALMKLVWGVSDFSSIEYAKWQYLDNPFGPALGEFVYPHGLRSDLPSDLPSELAAQYITVPSELWFPEDKSVSRVLLSVNTATHPKHQKKGLFSKSATRTFERAKQGGFKAAYGFPNANSLPGFVSKTGFVQNRELQLFTSVLSYSLMIPRVLEIIRSWGFPALEETSLNQTLSANDSMHDAEAVNRRLIERIHVPRSNKWVTWRYKNHLTRNYYFIGDAKCSFVVRLMALKSLRVCLLMDILGEPGKECMENVIHVLSENKVALLCGVFPHDLFSVFPEVRKLLKYRVPLRFSPKAFYVIYKDLVGRGIPSAEFYYTLGDIDLY